MGLEEEEGWWGYRRGRVRVEVRGSSLQGINWNDVGMVLWNLKRITWSIVNQTGKQIELNDNEMCGESTE